jgi:chromosome segregation ATPase
MNSNSFNDNSITTLTAKYNLLYDNLQQVISELKEQKKHHNEFRNGQDGLQELIAQQGDQIKDNIEMSIEKMDGEIQKSLSHQKAENSRLQQQITQLNTDNAIIKNKLLEVQRRIDEITLQVGNEVLK